MGGILATQLFVSFGVIAVTVLIHALFTVLARDFVRISDPRPIPINEVAGTIKLTVVSLWLVAAHALSCGVWAYAYLRTGVSPDYETGLYFALTTYTTLGFGDVLAPKEWQLLTGFASLNGLLMFGLSAATLVDAAGSLRQSRR